MAYSNCRMYCIHKHFGRHEDLKQMLDSNKDNLKLEAMKRIIGVSNAAYFFYASVFCFYCCCVWRKL